MADIDEKLMGLLITAGGGLLLSQEYIKQRIRRTQWVCPWIRKRDSKWAYYPIINDLRLTDKEDFRKYLQVNTFILHITILQKTIGSHSDTFILFKQKLKFCVSTLSILYKWALFIKKFLTTDAYFCFYVMEFRKKRPYSAQVRLRCVLLKRIIST